MSSSTSRNASSSFFRNAEFLPEEFLPEDFLLDESLPEEFLSLPEEFLLDESLPEEFLLDESLPYFPLDINFPSLDETETVIPKWIHEVFLSFRGEDTRASFTSHLHASLQNDGINVFIDDLSLERGDLISDSLLQAIEDSQISVVVFSTNYADSRWCLDELVKIMECHRKIGQVVLPVFYDVDPSKVRHQTGEFGKAFQNLLDRIPKDEPNLELELGCGNSLRENLELRWRAALRDAAGLAGFVVVNSREQKLLRVLL